jgi:non-homologous end joining protein Ku
MPNRIKLDLLSARTGNPVTEQFVDAKTGDVVAKDALVKGYEFDKVALRDRSAMTS